MDAPAVGTCLLRRRLLQRGTVQRAAPKWHIARAMRTSYGLWHSFVNVRTVNARQKGLVFAEGGLRAWRSTIVVCRRCRRQAQQAQHAHVVLCCGVVSVKSNVPHAHTSTDAASCCLYSVARVWRVRKWSSTPAQVVWDTSSESSRHRDSKRCGCAKDERPSNIEHHSRNMCPCVYTAIAATPSTEHRSPHAVPTPPCTIHKCRRSIARERECDGGCMHMFASEATTTLHARRGCRVLVLRSATRAHTWHTFAHAAATRIDAGRDPAHPQRGRPRNEDAHTTQQWMAAHGHTWPPPSTLTRMRSIHSNVAAPTHASTRHIGT